MTAATHLRLFVIMGGITKGMAKLDTDHCSDFTVSYYFMRVLNEVKDKKRPTK